MRELQLQMLLPQFVVVPFRDQHVPVNFAKGRVVLEGLQRLALVVGRRPNRTVGKEW
jgi:hypothetical protein